MYAGIAFELILYSLQLLLPLGKVIIPIGILRLNRLPGLIRKRALSPLLRLLNRSFLLLYDPNFAFVFAILNDSLGGLSVLEQWWPQ